MPIYTYQCKNCKFDFETFLKMEERDLPAASMCPKCGEYSVVRVPIHGSFKINGYSEANGYSSKD